MVADTWWRKRKVIRCFKNSTSIVLQQSQNKVSFQTKDPGIALKSLLNEGINCVVYLKSTFQYTTLIKQPRFGNFQTLRRHKVNATTVSNMKTCD